ncbi:MAG: glycoside hydrolase family 3 N-terminal domain-containing protein [Bacteroidales bacterium]|jgi:beta-glucosidase|nr:glycoside hydrolase family 3 N-terminal domain-containing protein [Bacteroidales bacterium]
MHIKDPIIISSIARNLNLRCLTPIIFILLTSFSYAQNYTYPYLDPSVNTADRVNDLIGRLTLEEKAALMLYNSPAIERLGIPAYNWWSESLHGVARAGKATVFPQAIGLSATFDPDLVFRVAEAISDEARAKHQAAVAKGYRAQNMGLSFWSPNVNIFRDPRWGRGQETYGEDPLLTSIIGTAFVRGLQGDHPKYLKLAACAKHYVVHSGPEESRHRFNAVPDEIDFRETYLPAFRALVDADVEAVMCAYNRTYGEPCCGSPYLLKDILRDEFGFDGHVVSDCWALDDIWLRHKVVDTKEEAAAMAALAGVNLNCGYLYSYLPAAVEKGLVSEAVINEILKPLLKTRFRLGLFDPDSLNPWARIDLSVVNCEKHKELAREAAVKSIVLLKNDGVLPLNRDSINNIFVTGPMAADISVLAGNYNGYSGEMVTILEGIVEKAGPAIAVDYTTGVLLNNDSIFYGFWHAGFADVIIAAVGINRLLEGEQGDAMLNLEGGDRTNIEMPENQVEFIRKLKEKNPEKKLVVVVTGGSAIAMPEVAELADALLFAWYPGEQGGNALADIIFGDENPSGRLPVTFYKSTADLPPFDDYSMQGRTYRFFEGEVLFPFGYGLSYSEFEYLNAELDYNGSEVVFNLEISEHGNYGREVIQVYCQHPDRIPGSPGKTLVGFHSVSPSFDGFDKNTEYRFAIDVNHLERWDPEKGKYYLPKGEYTFYIGSSSEDIRIEIPFLLR